MSAALVIPLHILQYQTDDAFIFTYEKIIVIQLAEI